MFLGGVIVIITYITSLAANEKLFYAHNFSLTWFLPLFIFLCSPLEENFKAGLSSNVSFVGGLYEINFLATLIFCFLVLLLAIVRVIKLMKLAEGPLIKRLWKSNLTKIYACQV